LTAHRPADRQAAAFKQERFVAEPAHRRAGYGRACLTELLTWFHTDTDVRVVHLNATPEGAGMYQSAGFREPAFPSMRLLLERLPRYRLRAIM